MSEKPYSNERGFDGQMSALKVSVVCNSSIILKSKNQAIVDDPLRKPIIHPSTINLKAVRCPYCNNLLGFLDGTAQIKCYKCKFIHLEETRVAPTTNALI